MDDQLIFISEIEVYCRNAGIAESTFGRRVVNDGKFVGRLRAGKGVTTATVSKVKKFINNNQTDQSVFDVKIQKGEEKGLISKADRTPNNEIVPNTKGGNLKKSIMIGDSETDSGAAQDANIPFILIEGGYTEKKVNQIYHNHLVKNFIGLEKIIEKYLND